RLYGLVAVNLAAKTRAGWLWASFERSEQSASAVARYRLRGTQTAYLDQDNQPVLLGNAVLEAELGRSASCMTCHARATLSKTDATRLPVFAPAPPGVRRGYVGTPDPNWYGRFDSAGNWQTTMASLDFMWSLSQAAAHGAPMARE